MVNLLLLIVSRLHGSWLEPRKTKHLEDKLLLMVAPVNGAHLCRIKVGFTVCNTTTQAVLQRTVGHVKVFHNHHIHDSILDGVGTIATQAALQRTTIGHANVF